MFRKLQQKNKGRWQLASEELMIEQFPPIIGRITLSDSAQTSDGDGHVGHGCRQSRVFDGRREYFALVVAENRPAPLENVRMLFKVVDADLLHGQHRHVGDIPPVVQLEPSGLENLRPSDINTSSPPRLWHRHWKYLSKCTVGWSPTREKQIRDRTSETNTGTRESLLAIRRALRPAPWNRKLGLCCRPRGDRGMSEQWKQSNAQCKLSPAAASSFHSTCT